MFAGIEQSWSCAEWFQEAENLLFYNDDVPSSGDRVSVSIPVR